MNREKDSTRKIEFAANKNVKERDYWLSKLSGEIVKSHIYYDYKKDSDKSYTMDKSVLEIPLDLYEKLSKLSDGSYHKLHMILTAGLVLLLHKYTGNNDIILGTPIYKQEIKGEFVNTVLALRNPVVDSMTFRELLLSVRQTIFEAAENQNYPIQSLVIQLKLPVKENEFPLFDAAILLENIHDKCYLQHVLPRMYFIFAEMTDSILGAIEYHPGYYKRSTMEQVANHYTSLLGQALSDVNRRLCDFDILYEAEKKKLIKDLDYTDVSWPYDKTVTQLFEDQVDKYPGKTAAVFENETLTYRELDEKANRIANYLHLDKQTWADHRIGLLMEKSGDCIAAILGILKSGGGYVPIDPGLPEERIAEIIDDADIEILISEKKYIRMLNRLQWQCSCLNTFLCLDSWAVEEEEEEESALMDRKLWEYVGESAVDDITGGGWKSSYTEQAISQEEMTEYAQNALAKVSPFLHPGCRVLEIGCATGLTMYLVAPKTGLYYGTDLSPVIIERNRQRVETEGHTNIKLDCLPAHEIHKCTEKNFDLIIMNSVIQHFSGHNYLRKVITDAIQLLAPQGIIFIGDIMDLEQKQALINDLSQFKKNNPDKNYRTKTDWSEELFISKSFFRDLEAEIPSIRSIEFSAKIRAIENELTKFRYDALIAVDKNMEFQNSNREKLKFRDDLRALENHSSQKPEVRVEPHHLLYIIYTSGTTGKPKGVMIEHRNIVRLMENDRNLFDFNDRDVWTMFHAYNFDFSVWEMYGALLHGGKLILIPRETARDTEKYLEILEEYGVTVLNQTPAAFYRLMEEEAERPGTQLKLRYLIFGGEALVPARLKSWLQKYPQTKIINMYGITETTVHVTYKDIGLAEIENNSRSIGRPIPTLKVVVLDRKAQLLPVGAPGELHVGGAGVARGYLNRPELSAEKFKKNNHNNHNNRSYWSYRTYIFYKTGDLVRVLNTGELEYLGRIDQQVKIRGFRIELGEIEIHIRKHEAVKDVAVIVKDDGYEDRYLCAFVVWNKNNDILELKEYLAKKLPEYMIPLYFVPVERIPLTPNGKLDLKALPEPNAAGPGDNFIAPRNEIEEKMTEIWANILHVDKGKISMNSNFFELGGHSLKATVLIANIHKAFNVKVPLAEVFKTPTIRELVQFIRDKEEDKFSAIPATEMKEYYPLSSAQKRLFVFQEFDNINYNYSTLNFLEGDINVKKLEQAFKGLIQRHESLRTSFHLIQNQPVQKIWDEIEFNLDYHEPVEDSGREQAIIKNFIRPFDLSQAPLLRVGLIKKSESIYILMFDMHHIIYDGISLIIFEKELFALYNGEVLPSLRIQYKDYAVWQNSPSYQGLLKKQEVYWQQVFKKKITMLDLPTDYPRPSVRGYEGHSIGILLDKVISGKLKKMISNHGVTLFTLLLAAYNVLLHKYTGQNDIIVGSSNAGRKHSDLQDIMGMFVNMVAMRNFPDESKIFSQFLVEVKDNVLNAFENQDYPYEELLKKLNLQGNASRDPLNDAVLAVSNYNDLNPMEKRILKAEEVFALVKNGSLTMKPYEYHPHTHINFDLQLMATEIDDQIHLLLMYSTRLYKPSTAKQMLDHFMEILKQILEDDSRQLKNIILHHHLGAASTGIEHDENKDFIF